MLAPDLFRSLLPLHNSLGFGPADFVLLAVAVILLASALVWQAAGPLASRLAAHLVWSMLALAALPVLLRLFLLPHHPVPVPEIYDEFSHLLMADTLRHFRLTNPAHPLHRFFETMFVLQQPTYSSIYPPGQGIVLALGWTLFGTPWAGVVLATAAFCALVYWMLRGWTTPGWALAGGALAVMEFGPLNPWMNDYWGGAVAAAAGCLVFGALPRLRAAPGPEGTPRDAILLAVGLALHLVTRPYESIFLFLSVALYWLPALRQPASLRPIRKLAPELGLVLLPAAVLLLVQNKQVTGSWTTIPEMLSQYQYGVPSAFTWQPNPVPHYPLTPQQEMDYKMQLSFHGPSSDTPATYLARLQYRARYYRFFFLAPLYIALVAFVPSLREFRYAWAVIALLLFAAGTNFFPAFQTHYLGGVACLLVLISIAGLERIHRLLPEAARILFYLCVAHFLFWYGLHAFADDTDLARALRPYEAWDLLPHRGASRHAYVADALEQIPGKLLVFVRYYPAHLFQDEWVYNRADIDGSRVVFARDLGPEDNQELHRYYPDRSIWLLEPDFRPPRLRPYGVGE
jgi:hypothetical protein